MAKYYIILFLFPLLSACSADKQTEKLLMQVDSVLEEYPDSALHLLNALPNPQELSRKESARYALLVARATDKAVKSLLPCDSLLDIALHYYDKDEKEQAVALLYKGRLEIEMNNTEESISHLQEGLSVLNTFPEEIETRRHTLSSLGNLYFDARYYKEAIKIYRELYDCCITDKDKAIALNAISSYYIRTGQEDSTITTRHRALEYAINSKDSTIAVNSLLALSLDYYEYDKLDSALFYAQKAISNLPKREQAGRYYYNLGSLLLELGENRDTASYYIHKSMEDNSFNEKFLGLLSLSDLEKERGNYHAATNYLEEYIVYLDSIATKEQSTKIQQIIYGYNTKIQVKEEQIKGQHMLWKAIIVFCSLCFLIILIYQNRINRKKQQQLSYQQTLQQIKDKLSSLQTTIKDNQSIISHLQRERYELEEEQQNKEKEIEEREQTITQLQKEKLQLRHWLFTQSDIYKKICTLSNQKSESTKKTKTLTTAEQSELKDTLFSIYIDYIDTLRQKYPRLTEDDLLLLCLQETLLESKTIAICLGYGDTHPINQRKYRIKERMNGKNM